MRLHVLSDLHLEFGNTGIFDVACDAVVLAGDIHTKTSGIDWIKERFADRKVIYVAGNHEFYGDKFPRTIEKIKQKANFSQVSFLENEAVEIDGVFFYGGTCWTDMDLLGDVRIAEIASKQGMNDYSRVRHSTYGYRKLRVSDTVGQHRRFLQGLETCRQKIGPEPLVVVSHHAPSMRSLAPEQRDKKELPFAYASHLESIIQRVNPLLWIHGHTHQAADYVIGSTRIIANPRGYAGKMNQFFAGDYVVDIGPKVT